MRLLLLIALFLLASLPGRAEQLQGAVTVNTPQSLNNAGLDAIGRHDYDGAERYLRQAYSLSVQNKDGTRMQTSLGNLSALYQITGKAVEKGRIDAIMQQLNRPAITAEPCSSCWHQQVQALQTNQVELMNMQNGFDRQTFREDQGFQLMYQRQAQEAQQRQTMDNLVRQQEMNQINQINANTRATSGTSYWSRYNQ